MRSASPRATFGLAIGVLAAVLAVACAPRVKPAAQPAKAPVTQARMSRAPAVPTSEIQGPPPPGVRLPRWLPRAEVFFDGSLRYRFFDRPRVTFEGSVPNIGLTDQPVIAGRIGLKLNVDAAGFASAGGAAHVPSDVAVRRAYLTSSGVFQLLHPIQYNLEFGLLKNEFYLDSAWLMWRNVPWVGTIRAGALDAPIGFENRMSSRDRTFMEMPAPVQAFVPATSLGLFARRTFKDDRISAGLGWYSVGQRRDVGDQSRALARLVGRVTGLVRDREDAPDGRLPELVHLGLAGSYAFAGTDHVRFQSRPETFLAPVAVDTGDVDASQSFVLGLEAAGRRGPLSVQGEFLNAFVNRGPARFPGMYLSASYLLTGEVRPCDREQAIFGQVLPLRPLSWRARTWGAAECAARWSWVDLDDGEVQGGRMHELSAGFNWYWNQWVRWQAGYSLALADGGPLDGRLHVFQARFQLVL
jgi:phosphate-selective porin OprO/OprP